MFRKLWWWSHKPAVYNDVLFIAGLIRVGVICINMVTHAGREKLEARAAKLATEIKERRLQVGTL